jgi:hypothetical protein
MYFVLLVSSSAYKYCGQLRRMTVTLVVVAQAEVRSLGVYNKYPDYSI